MPYIKSKLDRWYEHLSESVTSLHHSNVGISSSVILVSFYYSYLFYFVSAAVTVDSSHVTASSALWSSFSAP